MPFKPSDIVRVYCSDCGWTRIMDFSREYRGGHTNPTSTTECHGMLRYELITEVPAEVVLGLRDEGVFHAGDPLTSGERDIIEAELYEPEGAEAVEQVKQMIVGLLPAAPEPSELPVPAPDTHPTDDEPAAGGDQAQNG